MWVSRRGVHRACALRKLIPQRASLASSFVKTAHTFSYGAFNGAEKSEVKFVNRYKRLKQIWKLWNLRCCILFSSIFIYWIIR